MIWKMVTAPSTPPGALMALIVLVLVTVLPLTLFYLYVVFPGFLGDTIDYPILEE